MSAAKSVIIIGGGIAGLACGAKLVNTPGFSVKLLEASDRIGGRVKTAKFGEEVVELGAQWVHGKIGNRIFSLVHPFDILEEDSDKPQFNESVMFVTENGDFLSDEIQNKVFKMLKSLTVNEDSAIENEPLGQFATREFWKHMEEEPLHESEGVCAGILDWIHRFQNTIDGSESWFLTSCRGQLEYVSCKGNPTISWKRPASYATLIDTILNGRPNLNSHSDLIVPDWIQLQKEVTSIHYSVVDDDNAVGNEVVIRCKDGSEFQAHHVVCTVSLGVLKHDHATMFKPLLSPEKIHTIENLGFGTVNKIFLQFDSAWWPTNTYGFNFVWDDCCKVNENWIPDTNSSILLQENAGIPIWCRSLLGFYTIKTHPCTLFTWITGPPACVMETLDNETLETALVNVLQKFLGSVFPIPNPRKILRSKWNSNTHTRGSYSFRTIHSEDANVWATQLAEPITTTQNKPLICFAGEATHSQYFSTVHGAYETGVREAERLIKCSDTPVTKGDEVKDDKDNEGICCTLLNFA